MDTIYEQSVVLEVKKYELRKIVRWIVYAAALLIPLWFLPFTADIVEFNKQILLLVLAGAGLVLFLIDMIKGGTLRYRTSVYFWPLFGMVLATIIASAVSVQRHASLFGMDNSRSFSLITLLSLVILFFLALNVIEDRGKALRDGLVVSAGLALIIGVLQMLGWRTFNTVGSLNALAFLGAALLPLFLVASESMVKWQKTVVTIIRYLGIASLLFLLVVLNWAPLWIIAFISVLAYIAFTSSTEVSKGKMKFFALPMAILVIGTFLWIINFNWASIRTKIPVEVSPTHQVSYGIAQDALKEKPFGYGPENYVIAYDLLRPKEAVNNVLFQARFTDSTSEFATMITEGGILMLIAFLALLFFFVRNLVKNIRTRFGDDSVRGKIWASSLALLVLFFFYPLGISALFAFFMLLALGSLADGEGSERVLDLEGRSVYSFVGSLAFIVGLVLVLVGGYFMANQYIGNVYFAKAVTSEDRLASIDYYVKSINSYREDSRPYRSLSQALIAQVAEDLKTGPKKDQPQAEFNSIVQNRIASAVNVAVRATDVNPADSENWLNRGFVYQNLIGIYPGTDEAALNMYQEVLKRSPAHALAHVRMGNLHLSLNKLDLAEENYKQAIALYNNYGQALYNLAVVYDRKGELPEAIKQFEKLQAGLPRDPSVLFQLGLLYYRNNQKDSALRAWEQSVLSFPNYSNARWYLSLIYEERGDLKRALAEVQEIEKFNKDNALVKERLESLAAGIRQIVPPEDVLDQTPLSNEQ